MTKEELDAQGVSLFTTGLDAFDRCDRCPAAAAVRFSKGDMHLLFCAHHSRKNDTDTKLIATGWNAEK